MIYVTGDTHALIDISKLDNFSNWNNNLTKADYMIIAGDAGIVWSKKTLEENIKKYESFPFTVLFVDGNHENFDMLNSYPIEIWNGGKIHRISDHIIHLTRGQVFTIDGITIFTMGGGTSIDYYLRTPHISWWEEEIPSINEIDEAKANLAKYDNKVDYIITHSCDTKVLYNYELRKVANKLNQFMDNAILDYFEENVSYKHWYFGHYHADIKISDKKTCLYYNIEYLE